MTRLFGYHQYPLGAPRLVIGFPGLQPETPEPKKPTQRLYAFSQPLKGGGGPRVFIYEDTENGRKELANLIRGERVHKVVLGHEIPFESASVVELQLPDQTLVNRTVIPGL